MTKRITKKRKKLQEVQAHINRGSGSLNNYAVVLKSGELLVDEIKGAVCVAALSRTVAHPDARYYVDQPLVKFKKNNAPHYEEYVHDYLNWVVKRSVWSKAFMRTNSVEVLEKGIVSRMNYPSCYVVQGMIAIRYLSEFPVIPRTWAALKEFTDPHIAFFFAHFFSPVVDKKLNKVVGFKFIGYAGSIHHLFSYREVQRKELLQWCKKDLSWAHILPSMRERLGFRPLNEIWWRKSMNPNILNSDDNFVPLPKATGLIKTVLFGKEHLVEGISTETFKEFLSSLDLGEENETT